MHSRRLLPVVTLLASLMLGGCSVLTGAGLPGLPGGPATATVSPDPAPSGVDYDHHLAVRVNQVRRSGQNVGVDVTVSSGSKQDITSSEYGSSWVITTNTGVKISESPSSDRHLEALTSAAVTLDIPLPDAGVTGLTLKLRDAAVTVPLPAKDGAVAYLPAKLRQVGLAPQPIRDAKGADYVIETVRSEGEITEVTYAATALVNTPWYPAASICAHDAPCYVEEADGTKHALLGGAEETFVGRDKGTLRFLGELKPDATALKLHLEVEGEVGAHTPTILDVTLPTHADSPTQAVAGSLARPAQAVSATLTDAGSGAVVVIDRVDVLSDHTQVHLTAKGGTKPYDLVGHWNTNPSGLIESTGVLHPLSKPEGTDLVVPAAGTLDATLAFLRATPADVTSVTLRIGGALSEQPVTTKLTIPAAPDANSPSAQATLGQVEKGAAASPAPTVGPAPTPTARKTADGKTEGQWSYGAFNTSKLTATSEQQFGLVKSAIKGVGLASQTASATDVDPGAAAAAERSLKDLGAKQTPDGLVLTLPETVLFDFNKSDLKPDAQATITKVAALLKYYDKAKIGVQGHTDNKGDAAYNQDLSVKRAQAVADALGGGGVASSRMTVTGFGLTKPVASNDTDAGRAQNRRVEIVLTEVG